MRIGKPLLMAVLAVALGAYAFDCETMTTTAVAMQCCKSMHCSSHHHHGMGQHDMDCCKTMPSTHGPFVQRSSVHLSFSSVVFAVMPVSGEPLGLDSSSSRHVAARGHAPPIFYLPDSLPLRI
jgi:hypothetical protein